MKKLKKLYLILALTSIPTAAIYADTRVNVIGITPSSTECTRMKLQGKPFSIRLTMPSSQYNPATINSTLGFSFNERLFRVNNAINNEGVQGSCDYYLNPTNITIGDRTLTLNRLLINSVAQGNARSSVCTNVTVTLSILSQANDLCTVSLTE